MKKILVVVLVSILALASQAHSSPKRILVCAGAASKPATEEAIKQFEQKTGVGVDVIFGGSGFVLSQIKLSKKGDLFFPGSSDFMELAKREGLVFHESEKIIVYLVPAINVQKGTPNEQLSRGRPSAFAADAAAVLRQVEDRVHAVQRSAPGEPRAFLALAERMSARLGGPGPESQQAEGPQTQAGAGGPSIILP